METTNGKEQEVEKELFEWVKFVDEKPTKNDGYIVECITGDLKRRLWSNVPAMKSLEKWEDVLRWQKSAAQSHPTTTVTAEDVKRWFQILVGKGEAAMFEDMKSQPSTVLGWVDVKDRLPEVGEDVLVYLTAVVLKGVLYHDGWMVFYSDGLFECKDVTHWMPLPEPPNKSNSTPTPTNEIEKSFSLEQVKELLSQQRSMCADAFWNNRFGFMGTMTQEQCKQIMIYIENYDPPLIKADNFSNSLTEDQLKKWNEGIIELKNKIIEIKNK